MLGLLAQDLGAVNLSGGNVTLVVIIAVISVGALAMGAKFRGEVLAASEGTEGMKEIAKAVQEGAMAYLQRQFRTLGIFAAVAFAKVAGGDSPNRGKYDGSDSAGEHRQPGQAG